MRALRLMATISSAWLLLAACEDDSAGLDQLPTDEAPADTDLLPDLELVGRTITEAQFTSPAQGVIGRVVLTNTPNSSVLMRLDVKDLEPGWHGVHLHQTADCSDGAAGFKASGGHVNPDEAEHGLMNPFGPERADLPNLYARDNGRATAEIIVAGVTLYAAAAERANAPYPLIDADGFAIIIHAYPDDHLSQPIGGAGDRIACAAITGSE